MNKEEFREKVKSSCPEELVVHVPIAIDVLSDIFLRDGQYYQADVAKVIQYLGRLVPLLAQKDEGQLASFRLTAEDVLTSDYLANLLSYKMKETRRFAFNAEEAPFDSYEDAIAWMEGQSVELTEDTIVQMQETQLRMLLPYLSGEEISYIYPKPESNTLWLVVKEAHRTSKKIGFTPISVALYILVDIKPLLTPHVWSSVSIPEDIETENGSVRYRKRWVDIRLNTEISWNELLALYRSIRGSLGVTKNKMASNKHLELYELVQRKGAPPEGRGKLAFFTPIMEEWNRLHPEDLYHSWQGINMAYNRIVQKLRARLQIESVI